MNLEIRQLQPIEILRRLVEQRGLLTLAVVRRKPLEGVEDDLVAALAFIRREIALEHAAVDAERLDAGLDIGLPGCSRLLGVRRLRPFMEAEARQHHGEPAELHHDVRAIGDLLDRGLPGLEDLLAAVGITADADDPAAMIEAYLRVRKGAGEIGELAELGEEQPAVVAEPQWREAGKALAEGRIEQKALRPLGVDAGDELVRIPGRGMPDAAEAAVAGGDLRLQHRLG